MEDMEVDAGRVDPGGAGEADRGEPDRAGFEDAIAEADLGQIDETKQPEPLDPEGPLTGEVIGNSGANPDAWVGGGGTDLTLGARAPESFSTEGAAVAFARSRDGSSAVVLEEGRYSVYGVDDKNFVWSSGLNLDGIEETDIGPQATDITREFTDPEVEAIVTRDDYVVQFDGNRGMVDRTYGADPLMSHLEAFGPGLSEITDRQAFEDQFELAMRDTAFFALDQAEAEARAFRDRVAGDTLSPEDQALMEQTIEGLQALDDEIEEAQARVDALESDRFWSDFNAGMSAGMGGGVYIPSQGQLERRQELQANLDAARTELAHLKAERSVVARDFPALLRVENLDTFETLPQARQMETLREAADGVLDDIETTRDNIEDGDFNLWTMDGVRETTAAGLGIEGQQAEWLGEKLSSERRSEAIWAVGEAVVGIGLAAAGAVVTVGSGGTLTPLGAGLAAAGLAVGTAGAIDVTSDYLRNRAASDTALDPTGGLLPEGAEGHWGFVAAAWIGVGLEGAEVLRAINALRAGTKSVSEVAGLLGQSDEFVEATLAASRVNRFASSVLSDAAFDARFGSSAADAVTVIRPTRDGTGFAAEIITRRGLSPEARRAAVQHEMAHIAQLADPEFAGDVARLTASDLARWGSMSDADRMAAKQSQLRLEINARERLLAEGNLTPEEAALARSETFDLQIELDDVEHGLRTGEAPSWLNDAEPPYLFSGRTRLPRNNGRWEGEPGNGTWFPDNEAARGVIGDAGVVFRDGRPDFSPWSRGTLTFEDGVLDGSRADFNAVYDAIAVQRGLPSRNAAKELLRQQGLTPHHLDGTTIQLIPTDLHGNVPHIGSASDMRHAGGN